MNIEISTKYCVNTENVLYTHLEMVGFISPRGDKFFITLHIYEKFILILFSRKWGIFQTWVLQKIKTNLICKLYICMFPSKTRLHWISKVLTLSFPAFWRPMKSREGGLQEPPLWKQWRSAFRTLTPKDFLERDQF